LIDSSAASRAAPSSDRAVGIRDAKCLPGKNVTARDGYCVIDLASLFDVASRCQGERKFPKLELHLSVLSLDHVLTRKKHSFKELSVSSRT
jgi:hypothetical protein